MMKGDLEVMDRLVRLTGEPDRYHGFARPGLAAATEAASPGVSARNPRRRRRAKRRSEAEGKLFLPANP
jgi:hypothetical protein